MKMHGIVKQRNKKARLQNLFGSIAEHWTSMHSTIEHLVDSFYPQCETRVPKVIKWFSEKIPTSIWIIPWSFECCHWVFKRRRGYCVQTMDATNWTGEARHHIPTYWWAIPECITFAAASLGELTLSRTRINFRWHWRAYLHQPRRAPCVFPCICSVWLKYSLWQVC